MDQEQAASATHDRARPPTPRELLRGARMRALRGDRPYVVAFLAATGFALVVVSGPIQTWLTQRDLVDQREGVLAVLDDENQALAARVRELNDPDTIEAEAREQQGMVRPGEVPYVVVPPAVDQPQLGPDVAEDTEDRSWFERLREAIADILGG